MVRFFIHCLLKANWEDKKHQGILIKRSTFMTSLANLSEETGLSVKEVRTCIKKLIDTGEIKTNVPENNKKGKPYTVITVCKYDDYQKKKNKGANKGQGEGTERATTNNNNNENNNIIIRSFEDNFDIAISNPKYVQAMTTNLKITQDRLIELYDEFNQHLIRTQDTMKTQHMYVKHFRNWYLKKYRINLNTGLPKLKYKNSL